MVYRWTEADSPGSWTVLQHPALGLYILARGERQVSHLITPTWNDVTALQDDRGESRVTIYVPVHRRGREIVQDPLRFRNLLDRAASELEASGQRTPEVASLLQPARDLVGDTLFWSHQDAGLAVFLTPDTMRTFQVPFSVPEMAVAGTRFNLRPLVLGLVRDQTYFVLTLNRRGPRLLRGDRFGLEDIDLRGAPASLDDLLETVEGQERQFQVRTGARVGNRSTAVFHGHGQASDDDDERLLEYFRQLDASVMEVLRDERDPLLLAGIEYLLPLFRSATRYRHVMQDAADGNTEQLDDGLLHARTWALIEPRVLARADGERDKYEIREAHGEALHGVAAVLPAAMQGRVGTLLLADGASVWGAVDNESGVPSVHDERQLGDEELLDRALVETIAKGGNVYALEDERMPHQAEIAAILRY